MQTSVWMDRPRDARAPWTPATGESQYDVVVAGGGLTGAVSALLLARGGLRVALLEARRIGDGATGRSTAKVSLLQGTRLSTILQHQDLAQARRYVEANREGQAWLRRFMDDHGVAYQVRPAYTYATTSDGLRQVKAEADAAARTGLGAAFTADDIGLPFPVRGALALDDQLQVDPMRLLEALLDALEAEGATVYENSRVVGARHRPGGGLGLEVEGAGELGADRLVLAMGTPFLDRAGWFARLEAHRSYALTARCDWLPPGMYLSTDSPARSLRTVPGPDGDLLMAGGNGHPTGRGAPERERQEDLEAWVRSTWPGSEITHSWSAQDLHPAAGLPYAGRLLPQDDRILAATGYAKWGFTNATAAALVIAKTVLGGVPDWARAYGTWSPSELRGLRSLLTMNLAVAEHMIEGHVARGPLREGEVQAPICTHLAGRLRWNSAEETWDCPLHGSRFAPDGEVVCGPAVRALKVDSD